MRDDYRDERRRLYRDPEHGWIAGVCAGLARFLGVGRFCVRLVAIVCLFLLTVPTLIVYGILWLVLDRPPKHRRTRTSAREPAGPGPRSGLADRLRSLDERIRDIETRVTSRDFDLEEEFRRL